MRNGEFVKRGKWQGSRWCEVEQQYHGPLYDCENYPPEIRKEIAIQSENFVKNIPKIKDPVTRTIMEFFSGV